MEKKSEIENHIKKYENPSNLLGFFNLFLSFALYFFTVWMETSTLFSFSSLVNITIRALCYLRLFVTLHDLGHHAYFETKSFNNIFGYLVGATIGVPYNFWRFYHYLHHNFTNNLNFYQYGQSAPLTLNQFFALGKNMQKVYKFSYSTKGIIIVLPILFRAFFYYRVFEDLIGVIALFSSLIIKHFILGQSLFYDQIALHLASLMGVLIFHIQHTFPELKRYPFKDTFLNGLTGSTYLQVPLLLKFFTHGIEFHHVHHISSQVPAYRLEACHQDIEKRDGSIWKEVKRITIRDMFYTNLLVYDESKKRLISEQELNEVIQRRAVSKKFT
jgi:acyl-lipid omega-6 desaturase (Delta-12 desaturase)